MQTQIHLAEASYCDFVVWGPGIDGKGEVYIERIIPDAVFFETMCGKVHSFIRTCVIPEMLAKKFTAPVKAISHDATKLSEGCYCGMPVLDTDDKIQCTSGICKRPFMHRSCLQITSPSVLNWKCSVCKLELAKRKRAQSRQVKSAEF